MKRTILLVETVHPQLEQQKAFSRQLEKRRNKVFRKIMRRNSLFIHLKNKKKLKFLSKYATLAGFMIFYMICVCICLLFVHKFLQINILIILFFA